MKLQCNECGSTYSDTQRDGAAYFHACAPIHNPAYQPDPAKGAFDPREMVERPGARNENIDETALKLATAGGTKILAGPAPILSDGKGVTQI